MLLIFLLDSVFSLHFQYQETGSYSLIIAVQRFSIKRIIVIIKRNTKIVCECLAMYFKMYSLLTSLSVIVCTSPGAIAVENEAVVLEKNCSIYMNLVSYVIEDDDNLFQVQKTFFPPNSSPPAFVTVRYNFGIEEEVWFWSEAFFYLFHPLHIFQFTSLLFSDINLASAEVTLTLPSSCCDASEDWLMLLTQRVSKITLAQDKE